KIPRKSIDVDARALPGPQPRELRLFEVGGDVQILRGDRREQRLSGRNGVADFDRAAAAETIEGRQKSRIRKIESRAEGGSLGGTQRGLVRLELGALDVDLARRVGARLMAAFLGLRKP